MNYQMVFDKTQEQYAVMFEFIESCEVSLACIKENITLLRADYKKMDKRISRIEAKLKLADLDLEDEPKSETIDLKEGD